MSKKKRKNGKGGEAESASTPATEQLEKDGVHFEAVSYEHDPDHMDGGYGLEGAAKLGIDPHQAFKTLMAGNDEEIVVGVVPVSGHLDMKKLAKAAGLKKIDMVDPAVAARVTGYVPGGISPFGQRTRHRVFLDSSALDFPAILVSGGKRGFSVMVSPQDLVDVTHGTIAPIARDGSHPVGR